MLNFILFIYLIGSLLAVGIIYSIHSFIPEVFFEFPSLSYVLISGFFFSWIVPISFIIGFIVAIVKGLKERS